ncbi:MAG: hypothetical protein KF795_01795 [Labilithrix sp.]|nr:hypothetical protein [Labilithrix sp.]
MARSQIPIDTARAAKDGNEYHEAWVARKSLGLLLPRDGLVGIAIEGFALEDQATKEATEIADAVLYYGPHASFDGATRVVVVQVKYSKASEHKPFRAADAKRTIAKFATTYRAHKSAHGAARARARLRFELVTNRPILPELTQAIQASGTGSPMRGTVLAQAQQLRAACRLRGKDLAEFLSRLRITGIAGDLTQRKHELAIAVADWSPARDLSARLRLNLLCNLARAKASLAAQDRNVITRADVLTELGLQHEDDLLPCPASFPDVGTMIERVQLADTAQAVPRLTRPLVIHADAGVGKTVFMRSLASRLATEHEVVLFDCFGSGQYRAPSDARHLPQRGLIHIANLLACQGLCDPILPGSARDDELLKTFRLRLAQAAETGRRGDPNRQLVLLMDAIDNASEHAHVRGEPAFPRLLVEEVGSAGAIAGVQIVVSSRSHRRAKATGGTSCDEIELLPFTLDESRGYLGSRVDDLTEAKLQVAQSRSRGNARVLEHLAKDDPRLLAPTKFAKVIALDDLLRKRIDDALAEARRQGYQDTELRAFLAGLATLPPPVPIREFAEANGLSEGAVNSFAADLASLLEQTKHGLMFRDEPTETLILETYAADQDTLRTLASNLNGMQAKSLYAATTLPELLQQLADGEQLFNLAFDDRLPATLTSAAGKHAIRQARLRAAVAYATQNNQTEHLVRLLVELSTIAAVNQRGTKYLLDNPDLTVNAADADSIRRLFEARTSWPGTRHARVAIVHVLAGDLADAHRHAFRVDEWRQHHFNQDEEGRRRNHGPTALDMASLPLCLLARGEGEAAAHEISQWYDWFGFEVAEHLFAFVRAGQANGVIAPGEVRDFLTSKAVKPGMLAAAIAHADSDAPLQRELVAVLARTCGKAKFGEPHYRPHERPVIRGMLRAATVGMVLGMAAEAGKIVSAAKLPVPTLHTFMDDYWTGDVYPFIAAQVLNCLSQGVVPEEKHLLPRELAELAAGLPPGLQGKDFRDALKTALEESYKTTNSQADAPRRLSYETKSSAERFLDSRLDAWLRVATAFAQAISSSGQGRATLAPLIALWSELRATDDYYTGGAAAQRQHNAVGERLITLALAANPEADLADVGQFIDLVAPPGEAPPSNVVDIIGILAGRGRCHVLAGTASVRLRDAIEREDDVTQRASLFARLSRAIAPASTDDSIEYFRIGLEQMDAIGSGDWEFVNELMHFASTLRGDSLSDTDSHTLSNICDLNLGDEYKFDWARYGVALARGGGVKGLARLSRWEDRERISLDYTLLPYLKALLDAGKVDPEIALTMLRVSAPAELYVCGTEQLVGSLESRSPAPSTAVVRELIGQYKQNTPSSFGSKSPLALARLAKQSLGDTSEEYLSLSAASETIESTTREYNDLNNWRAATPVHGREERQAEEDAHFDAAKTRAAATDPLDEAAVALALADLDGVVRGRRLQREFLSELRAQVPFAGWPRYIEIIARQEGLALYDKTQELCECKAAWSAASSAVAAALKASAELIVRANADEFVSSGSLSEWHLKELTDLTGVDQHAFTVGLLKEFSRPGVEVPASVWLSFAAAFNVKAAPGAGQDALHRLLVGGAAKLAPLVVEGAWREGLYPTDDPVDVAAGLIWFALGSPKADRRWMAAHSLRTAVRLDRADVLDAVVERFGTKDAGPFCASELPFFYLHAQLWLLIAMARVALEAPAIIARHREMLERVALGSDGPHVLRRHFAKAALFACAQGGALQLKRPALNALKKVNQSLFAAITTRDYPRSSFDDVRPSDAPVPEKELHLDYDFNKYDVSILGRLFGRPMWEIQDGVNRWVRAHDTQITHMHDTRGRTASRRQRRGDISDQLHTYGEQLCWHGLHAVAGQYLAAYPVVKTPYDEDSPWDAWLRRRTLTREDNLWLSDGTDWRPLDTRCHLREIGPDGVGLTIDPVKLRALLGVGDAVGEWLVVDGDWSSVDGVGVHIQSALVLAAAADSAAARLAEMDAFQAFLPVVDRDYESRGAHRQSYAPYLPWIVQSREEGGFDGADTLGVVGAAHRARLGTRAIDFGQLKMADPFGRYWIDPSGASQVHAQTWCQVADRRDEGRSVGARLLCRTDFVRRYLTAEDADLLLLVILRQTDSGSGGRSTRYWHTTAVIRLTPALDVTFYPGAKNELHKSDY